MTKMTIKNIDAVNDIIKNEFEAINHLQGIDHDVEVLKVYKNLMKSMNEAIARESWNSNVFTTINELLNEIENIKL